MIAHTTTATIMINSPVDKPSYISFVLALTVTKAILALQPRHSAEFAFMCTGAALLEISYILALGSIEKLLAFEIEPQTHTRLNHWHGD
jgi:hypothetical protein